MSRIFYSKNCPNCLEFLKKLREENMLDYFEEFFCIDNRKNLPPFLHHIPTIIVEDANKPLVGDDAFAWLNFKIDEKYKVQELGTLDGGGDNNFCDLTKDATDINLDSSSYISIHNIDKPLKPEMTGKFAEQSGDLTKQMDILQQERAQLLNDQKGPAPQTPNFQR